MEKRDTAKGRGGKGERKNKILIVDNLRRWRLGVKSSNPRREWNRRRKENVRSKKKEN